MSQPADAAELFEQAVALAPERLDVRRELAEVLVALGDRPAARKLFKDGEAAEGAAENFLDMAQFMVAQGLLAEARAAAEKRLAESPGNFDLRLLLIEIYGKIGAQRSGEEAITGARALADTPARYSRWLDTAAMFHELFDTAEPFFDAEHLRLMGADPEWTPELAEKFLAFCSAADRGDLREKVADYLREQIGSPTLPEDLRPVLRRLLVESLGSSPEHAAEIQSQLQILAQEDKEKGDAYKLRLALTMHQPESGRTDQARALLEEADPSRVEDAELLGGMHLIYLDYGMPEKALAALARQVELEPENKAAWADWITLLAALGDEENLRTALRRLTAGAGKLELSEDTHELIRGHLVDSYWRSIARLIADGGDGTQAEALAMLDAVERAKQLGEERLWVLWTRAFLYSGLGQNAARDEALAELTAAANVLSPRLDPDAAATATAPPTVPVPDAGPDAAEAGAVAGPAATAGGDPSAGQPVKIRFPDGLALSLDAAAQVLTDPPVAPPHADADNGPMAPLGVRWAFEVASGAAIAQVLPLGGGERVFILDIQGNASVLDAASGKVLWEDQVTKPIPTGRRRTSGGRSIRTVGGVRQIMHTGGASQGYRLPAQAAATGDGSTIIVPTYAGTLRAFSAAEGDLLWESEIAPPEALPADRVRGQLGGLMPSVFAEGGRAIAYEPASGVACAFEGKTGKLVWSATVVEEGSAAGMNLHALNTGASLSGGYLLVYGRKAAILRADDGRLVWEFAPTSARRFPLDIKTVDDLVDQGDWWGMPVLGGSGAASTPWSGLNAGSYSSPFGRPQSMAHLGGNTSYRTSNARQFVGQPGALLAPAALWAQDATAGNFSRAELRGRRLLLMGNGSAPVQSLSLDFPLAARPIGVYGIFAGWAGGKFVTVQNRQSSIFNASTGAGNTVELDPIASPEKRSDGAVAPVGLLQATVAGARVYYSGPRGILCVNAHTGSEIFRSPWPEAAVEFAGDSDWVGGGSEERPGDETATPGGQTPVQAISRSGGQQGGSGLSTNWYGYTNNDYAGPCQPLLNTAANGILYAIATPGRLIALGAEDGGGE
ncbi:MAG: PQQ-binding-like beta-propeller repeat protein [Verrucomicrobiales bacterium]